MIRRPPRSTQSRSSAASDVYKRQEKALGGAQLSGFDFGAFTIAAGTDPLETLAGVCKRHPMREDQAIELLVNSGIYPLPVLDALRADPRFRVEQYGGQTFFLVHEMNGRSSR